MWYRLASSETTSSRPKMRLADNESSSPSDCFPEIVVLGQHHFIRLPSLRFIAPADKARCYRPCGASAWRCGVKVSSLQIDTRTWRAGTMNVPVGEDGLSSACQGGDRARLPSIY